MPQVIRNHGTRQFSTETPELTQYASLIHLRQLRTPKQLRLALQVLNKVRRIADQSARLLVATSDDQFAWPSGRLPPQCSFHEPAELRRTLWNHNISILTPSSIEPPSSHTLHALASGVPLTALNLVPLSLSGCATLDLDGTAFLAIGHVDAKRGDPPPH